MPKLAISKYSAEWNPITNKGVVFIQVGFNNAAPIPIDNTEEFIILLMMLGKSGVQYDSATREIEIPPRPVGT